MDRFVHGLRFLGERAGLSLDEFLNELGALNQTEQVIAKIVEVAESLSEYTLNVFDFQATLNQRVHGSSPCAPTTYSQAQPLTPAPLSNQAS